MPHKSLIYDKIIRLFWKKNNNLLASTSNYEDIELEARGLILYY